MTHAHPPSVASICKAVGRRAIAESVGVGTTAVSNAVADGRFPARWFAAVNSLCAAAGHPCPLELFSFAMPPASATEGPQAPAHSLQP